MLSAGSTDKATQTSIYYYYPETKTGKLAWRDEMTRGETRRDRHQKKSFSNFNWIAGRWNGTINYWYTTWRGFRLRKKSNGCLQLNELDRMLERPSVAGISTSFLDGRTSRMNDRGSDKSGIQKLESISRSDAYPLPTPYQSFFIGPARTITRLSTRTELR